MSHIMSGITPDTLRQADHSAARLLDAGYSIEQCRNCDFTCEEFRLLGKGDRSMQLNLTFIVTIIGKSVDELRCGGFTAKDMREGGFNCKELNDSGYNLHRLRLAGYLAVELRERLHVEATELHQAGYTADELRLLGYRANELKELGMSAKVLKDGNFSEGEVMRAGFLKEELKPIGCWPHDGQWNSYNQHWTCCQCLDKKISFCEPVVIFQSKSVKL